MEDTVILSGMGTHTIIDILNERDDIKYCIISAHTDVTLFKKMDDISWICDKCRQIVEEKKYTVYCNFF